MSIENVTTALQVAATTGNGFTFFLPEPRFVTFRVTGNGSVTGGALTIEVGTGRNLNAMMTTTPLSGTAGAGIAWTTLTVISVPANSTVEYSAGSVSGNLRARISTTVTGGTVTVTAVRPESFQGWSRRPS
jgi:hypothetical protein